MDVAIPARPRRARWIALGALLFGIVVITLAVSRLKPASPQLERSSLLIDVVQRGAMLFQVRGTGTLVPVDVRMIMAQVPCKVERVLLLPGTAVQEVSVIAELSSPELQQAAQDALWQMRQAEADYQVSRLNQKATLDASRANAQEALASLKAAERLQREGLQSDLDVLRCRVKAEEFTGRLASEEARMRLYDDRDGRLAPARARLEQAKALYALKREQVGSLKVRAGMAGILQQVPLQVGQQLTPGTSLAKVAKPTPLKAELKVSETQAKDILLGQPVEIDTRNGFMKGHVIRIDPAVLNGTVTVDVSLEGELPKGLRPDLSVEGIIELARFNDGIFVGRPAQAQSHKMMELFKLSEDGSEARRVKVTPGRASMSTIEVVEGLKPGDKVILSDASRWDGVDRIRLK